MGPEHPGSPAGGCQDDPAPGGFDEAGTELDAL